MIRRLLIRLFGLDLTGEIARLDLELGRARAELRSTQKARARAENQLATAAQIAGDTGDTGARVAALERRLATIAGICWAAEGEPEERLTRIGEALGEEGRHRA